MGVLFFLMPFRLMVENLALGKGKYYVFDYEIEKGFFQACRDAGIRGLLGIGIEVCADGEMGYGFFGG